MPEEILAEYDINVPNSNGFIYISSTFSVTHVV